MATGAWSIDRTLGRGSTATVYLATSASSSQLFAVKAAELCRSSLLQREQTILSSLCSPYIISYLGFDVVGGDYNLFMEYAPGGTLTDEILKNGGRLDEPAVRARTHDLLCGLAYLHTNGLAHCDVKGRNVLIGADGRAKIGDLGCAKREGDDKDRTIRGTPMYMAPEVARGEEQGAAADIWALGCTVIEMATGRAPWPDVSDPISALHKIAFSSDVPEFPSCVSEEAKDFLDKCLTRNPRDRWTAEQLLKHPFLTDCASKPSSNEKWVSPKSTLDQVFWDSLEEEEVEHSTDDPTERIRQLACGSGVANWTRDENWITVRGEDGMECSINPKPEQETSDQILPDEAPSESSSMIWVGSSTDSSASTRSTSYGEELVYLVVHMTREDATSNSCELCFINSNIDDRNVIQVEQEGGENSFCNSDCDSRDHKQGFLLVLSVVASPLFALFFGVWIRSRTLVRYFTWSHPECLLYRQLTGQFRNKRICRNVRLPSLLCNLGDFQGLRGENIVGQLLLVPMEDIGRHLPFWQEFQLDLGGKVGGHQRCW